MPPRLEEGAAAALIGLGVFQIHDVYSRHAGNLHDLRASDSASTDARQKVNDADVITGGMALLAGGTFSLIARKWTPIGIAVVSYGLVSWYYHRALAASPSSPAPMTEATVY